MGKSEVSGTVKERERHAIRSGEEKRTEKIEIETWAITKTNTHTNLEITTHIHYFNHSLTHSYPISLATATASSTVAAHADGATFSLTSASFRANTARSSVAMIVSTGVPRTRTP